MSLRARLDGIRDRIARAASRARRDPSSIRLVAVSKTFSAADVRAAAAAGQLDFGENKVQEGLEKMSATADLPLRWHLVGHLQSNKARRAVQFGAIHSIDSPTLLRKLDQAAIGAGRVVDALIQVDLAGEATKFGAAPDAVESILETARSCTGVRMTGLMLLPPAAPNPEDARRYFRALRELRDRLAAPTGGGQSLAELSMGMSHDFEVAIEEGATMVRVGTAIFGERS